MTVVDGITSVSYECPGSQSSNDQIADELIDEREALEGNDDVEELPELVIGETLVDWDGQEVPEVIEDPHRSKPLEDASEGEFKYKYTDNATLAPAGISAVVISVVVVVSATCCYCVWRYR